MDGVAPSYAIVLHVHQSTYQTSGLGQFCYSKRCQGTADIGFRKEVYFKNVTSPFHKAHFMLDWLRGGGVISQVEKYWGFVSFVG